MTATTSALRVRDAGPPDYAAMQAIYHACREHADWLPPHSRTSGDLAHDAYSETMLLAEDAQGVARGFVSAWLPESFIHHLYVDAAWRRRGVARTLLAALDGRAPAPWRLKCLCANVQALQCYDRLGWRQVGSGEDDDGRYLLLQSPSTDTPSPTSGRGLG